MKISKYIVLTENKKEVRFFVAGIINSDNTFTGIMHDYCIDREDYIERLVFEDKWISIVDSSNKPLDWDEQVAIFNELAVKPFLPLTVEAIEGELWKFIDYDTCTYQNYVPLEEALDEYFPEGVCIKHMSKYVPYGLGITSFVDGYKIVKSIEYNRKIEVA